jgi:hypothetical protein
MQSILDREFPNMGKRLVTFFALFLGAVAVTGVWRLVGIQAARQHCTAYTGKLNAALDPASTEAPGLSLTDRGLFIAETTKLAAMGAETTTYPVDILPDGLTDPLSGQTLPKYTPGQRQASYAAWSATFKIQALSRQGCG